MPDAGYAEGESWKTGSEGKKERMAVYLDWLLTPESERTPKTKTALAELLGVSTATLRNYSQDSWLQSNLSERSRSTARVERLPSILESLYRQAVDPDNPRSVQASKVYLDYLAKTEAITQATDFSNMSDAELKEKILQALSEDG